MCCCAYLCYILLPQWLLLCDMELVVTMDAMSICNLNRCEAILQVCRGLVSDLKAAQTGRFSRLHVTQHHFSLQTHVALTLYFMFCLN